jgi:hypothetical protein
MAAGSDPLVGVSRFFEALERDPVSLKPDHALESWFAAQFTGKSIPIFRIAL